MKTVIQRVSRAQVSVDGEVVGRIDRGIMALVGVERGDAAADAFATARKLASLRIFPGAKAMDRSLIDVGGSALVISQFTLAGTVRKGRRPSFNNAEQPERADELYQIVARELAAQGIPTETGRFGANMQVELVNDGPVTIMVFAREGQIVDPSSS